MSEVSLTKSRIRAGRWEGELAATGDAAPRVEIWHRETKLDGVETGPASEAGCWTVSVPIPAEFLSDGVQTFLVSTAGSGERLGQFTIVTGVPLEDDIRAEVDLLRAELDMLKKAFRRHCLETGG